MNDEAKKSHELDETVTRPKDLLSSMQIEKLNLEIESLRAKNARESIKLDLEIESLRKNNRWQSLTPIIPPLVSVVAVVASILGLLIGAKQFEQLQMNTLNDKKRERTTALEKQLHSDVDELSRFTQDKSQTLSRLSFLLADMKTVEASADHSELSPEAFRSYERSLTKALVQQIVNDADFMKSPRDVVFANTIAGNWNDYQEYLIASNDPETFKVILYKYVRALRYLHEHNTPYFKCLDYDEDSKDYKLLPQCEEREDEETLFQHIKQSVEGFKLHLDLLDRLSRESKDETKKQKALAIKLKKVLEFGDAVCIESVARHFLGGDFKQKRPCMLH